MPIILLTHREFLWPGVVSLFFSALIIFFLQSKRSINFLGKLSPRLIKFEPLSLSAYSAIYILFVYVGFWLVMGLSLIAFLSSFVHVDHSRLAELIVNYALSFCGGMLAVFTPSGLGVREILFAELLQPIYDKEIAMLISVATRLWSTIFEIFIVFVIWVVQRISLFKTYPIRS